MHTISATAFADSKPHYPILDGLRGVAAIMVLCYHIFEAFATSPADQRFNHGYLAVDFFFMLSGFVVGYAYGNRRMTFGEFVRRRLVRLHPMVVAGAVIGAALFFFGNLEGWKVASTTAGALLGALLLNMLLVPATRTGEVRGLGEMYPLNGPSWSLFFEYIGNFLYILLIRRLPTRALAVLVAAAGGALGYYAIAGYSGFSHLGVGWTLTGVEFLGGLLRLLFSFSAGLLLSRVFKPARVPHAFLLCAPAVVALLAMPRLFEPNGIYDTVCCLLLFPLIVWAGASGKITGTFAARICKFLGDISYPLYMVHYPLMYLYFAWVKKQQLTFQTSLPGALAVVAVSVLLAWGCLKLYDEPVRRFLTKRFLRTRK